jgi:signal transduction histidine kinase
MRWLPDSLFGRLVLTFVGVLVITTAITLWVQAADREVWVFRATAGPVARRIADLADLLERLPARERAALAAVASGSGVQTDLLTAAEIRGLPADAGQEAGAFRGILAEHLGPERVVRVAVGRRVPLEGRNAPERFEFTVWVRLEDGTGTRFTAVEPRRLPRWPMRVAQSLAVMLLVVSLLSVVAVRWVTRPLARLATAAEALGRDIDRPPLREDGPQEVRRAARAFNAMQERLSRYVRTRTAILAAMSHDLKTPITRLRLRAALAEGVEGQEKMLRDLDEMERMVTTTLDYMRGLEDREPLAAVDVGTLVEALRADAEELGQAVTVRGRSASPFVCKPAGLKRILQNLLDNALKYGSEVEVEIAQAPEALAIAVRDRGPGIPEDALERVFEPFYRLEASRNPATGGSGLGLSIARNIAQSMGGDVTLRNRDGGGLEARLVLPRYDRHGV